MIADQNAAHDRFAWQITLNDALQATCEDPFNDRPCCVPSH